MQILAEIVGGIVLLGVFIYGMNALFNYFMKRRNDVNPD